MDAFEGGGGAIRNRAGDANSLAVAVDDVFEGAFDVDLIAIATVDEDHAGHVAVTGLVPCTDGAGANAGHGVDDENHHVAHVDGVHGLAAEIGISGRVSKEEMAVFPRAMEDASVDGVLAFLFFGAEVGDGSTVVNAAFAADGSGFEKKKIGESGFTSAGMTGENEVSDFVCGTVFHGLAPEQVTVL